MIINKQQTVKLLADGKVGIELLVSYVNKNRGIGSLSIPLYEDSINQENDQLFNWDYITRHDRTLADKEWRSWDDKPIKKVRIDLNAGRFDNRKLLNDYRLAEILNGLPPEYNVIYDYNIPDTWFCDIETDVDDDGMSVPENPRTPVNTIALTRFPYTIVWGRKPLTQEEIAEIQNKISNHENEKVRGYKFYYRYFPNEADMLLDFFRFITQNNIPAITGWNFLGYDWPYLYNRCNDVLQLDISFVSPTYTFYDYKVSNKFGTRNVKLPMHRIVYDYLMVYEKWDQTIKIKENNSLDFVADKVLGYKKIQHTLSFKDFYAQDYVNYVYYNSVDTILVEQIDNKIHTANIWYSMGSILHTDLMSTFSTINPAEIVMANELFPKKRVLIPKKKFDTDETSFIGAFVWPSQPGIYKYIGGLDFASLYPTTIRQFNLSPETYKFTDVKGTYVPTKDEIKTSYGAVFDKTQEGIVPHICTKYYKQRKHSKMLKKQATKDYEYLKQILDSRKAEK